MIPKEEIKSETDPLWSIEISQQNLDVCKDFDEEIILEANLSVLVETSAIHISLYMLSIGVYTMKKVFPLSFGDIVIQITHFFQEGGGGM